MAAVSYYAKFNLGNRFDIFKTQWAVDIKAGILRAFPVLANQKQ